LYTSPAVLVFFFLQLMPFMYLRRFLIRFGYIIQVGSQRNFSFTIKDHVQLGKDLDLFDFDAASEV
jgi:hypothetical protein